MPKERGLSVVLSRTVPYLQGDSPEGRDSRSQVKSIHLTPGLQLLEILWFYGEIQ